MKMPSEDDYGIGDCQRCSYMAREVHDKWLAYYNWRMGRLPSIEELEEMVTKHNFKWFEENYGSHDFSRTLDKRIKNENI